MNLENYLHNELMSENRAKLLALEKTGKYVFHGTTENINILEPRQAYNDNRKTNKRERDGEPAVFATPYADVAIFRSLINPINVKGNSSSQFGMSKKGLLFSATENLINQAEKKIGKVYVLDKTKFKQFKGMQCRSEETMIPLEVIEVTTKDLPKNIKTINV